MEELMNLGDSYLENKDFEEAIKCYLKCLEINDNNFVKLKLCYLYILTRDYEMAFYYFINCYQVDPDYINIDYNLGIFLFSMLINLPDEYLDDVLNMELEDVEVLKDDLGYQNIKKENNLRSLIINQSFVLVKDILDKKIDFTNSIYNLIIKELINNIVEFQRETYDYQLKLVKAQEYQELIANLESSASKRQLSIKEIYILRLVKELVEIKDTFEIPIKVNFKTNSLYEAIDCKNYHLALEINKAYCHANFINRDNDIMFRLLNEIVKEINAIEEVNQGSDILDMDLGDIMEFDDMNFEIGEVDADEVISNIINYLNNNDLAMVYKEIDDFLIRINKLEYRFFLINKESFKRVRGRNL